MPVALIILIALVVVGTILYVHHRLTGGENPFDRVVDENQAGNASHGELCCGTHIVCEKDRPQSTEIIYYDDEELDVYCNHNPEDYSDDDIERFRDVLLTLLPADIAGWNHSLELRQIPMPLSIREEMLLIVTEARGRI